MKQHIIDFDNYFIALLQRLPVWTTPIFSFATFMGSGVALTGVGAATIGAAMLYQRTAIAIAMVICLLGGGAANLIKLAFRRQRPLTAYVMQFNVVTHYSFPSGHSASSSLVYGLLAYLAAHYLPGPWGYVLSGALSAFIVLIGLSRVYLGAHFPSDVIGGWVFGGLILMLATMSFLR